ncbi:MAG: flagellar assembly protein FliW [Lachnospiraceae bacterium]|nr:flagellar assembly protein FliW [Lachnospiraceae bacterium]
MKLNTRIFGEIEVEEDKVIHFVNGIIGFPELKEFALVFDEEKGNSSEIRWMQSIQEPNFAIPVIDPLTIRSDYNPVVEDELLTSVGEIRPEELLVLVTITVPADITQMSINLKAPIIINAASKKACQIIVEGDDYQVKYPIYDILQAAKKVGE